jgi:DNA polymerase-3 subunit gamma/tau
MPETTARPAGGAKLIIETPPPAPKNPVSAPVTEVIPAAGRGLAALQKLRQQVAEQSRKAEAPPREVTVAELQAAWAALLEHLRNNNGNPAVLSNLTDATLQINDDGTPGILTSSEFQKKFIENQRALIVEHLQRWFNNRTLTYKVLVEEKPRETPAPEQSLSRRQQYQKVAEAYPLVKELKERLKLELE